MTNATKCPICLQDRKVVTKCKYCGKKHCIECGNNDICIDCFVTEQEDNIISSYMDDKYDNKVKI